MCKGHPIEEPNNFLEQMILDIKKSLEEKKSQEAAEQALHPPTSSPVHRPVNVLEDGPHRVP